MPLPDKVFQVRLEALGDMFEKFKMRKVCILAIKTVSVMA